MISQIDKSPQNNRNISPKLLGSPVNRVFTACKRSVFTGICLSTGGGGAHMGGGMCGRGHVWQEGRAWEGVMHGMGSMHGRGHVWLGVCGRGACMAGGMHGRGVCMAGGHAWQGCAWWVRHEWQGVCLAGGHVWSGYVCGGACVTGGHAWQIP